MRIKAFCFFRALPIALPAMVDVTNVLVYGADRL
jgi:hypothetical protein